MDKDNEPISGVDTAWLRMDSPTNLMVINAMIVVESIEFDAFKQLIEQRFLAFERFKKVPVQYSGLYFWEPDPFFDLDNHVKKVALTGSADKDILQAYVSDQMSLPLDSHRPLWQIHFIENYECGSAILIRVHHCYADGISLINVFDTITDATPNVTALPVFSNEQEALVKEADNSAGFVKKLHAAIADNIGKHTEDNPWAVYQGVLEVILEAFEKYTRVGQRFSEESLHLVRDPLLIGEYAKEILQVVNEITTIAALPSDPETGLKGKIGVRKKCAWSEPLPFEGLKKASKLLGCKINDILVSSVAGALGTYLRERGEEVADKTIHATVPVNIRSEAESRPGNHSLGNNFGTVFLPLPIGIDNPIERVYKIKHDMLGLKHSLQPGLSYGLLYAVGMMPKSVQKPFMDVFSKKSTAVLSNVPGVREPRYLCGKQIKEQMFWVPQTSDIGLGMSLISYGGAVQFGVMTDAKLCENPQYLVSLCIEEMKRYIQMIDPYQEIHHANSRRCSNQP